MTTTQIELGKPYVFTFMQGRFTGVAVRNRRQWVTLRTAGQHTFTVPVGDVLKEADPR